jgi:23S rRNA pseudouridine955/2504/2580 synthase
MRPVENQYALRQFQRFYRARRVNIAVQEQGSNALIQGNFRADMTDRNNKDLSRAGARVVSVDADSAERRLDNFLMTLLKGLPRARIYRMIRTGEVRINKGRAKPSTRVAEGDQIRIPPTTGASGGAAPQIDQSRADWILAQVLHEDEHLLVIDKPAGLAVHGGSGISLGAIELLRAARPDCRFLELVHRLDRDTSGCLLIAKKRSALRKLHENFRSGDIDKIYLALLLGEWHGGSREVDLALAVNNREGGERHVRPDPNGKSALTRFFPQQIFSDCVLTRVQLLTGRTHQIRVHAAAIGHRVAGDTRYGEGLPGPEGLGRLFLHAQQLTIQHPADDRELILEAPLDQRLRAVLGRLKQRAKTS